MKKYHFVTNFAHLAQLVERKTFNLVAVGSSPTVGILDLEGLNILISLNGKAINPIG
jgi:hypothetical protein